MAALDPDRLLLETLKRAGRAAAAPPADRLAALAVAADLRAALDAARRRRGELAAALSATTTGASAAALYRRTAGLAPAPRSDLPLRG